MTKIITRCFQRGGALSNACRFLAKSTLTAFALVAATFTANAAEVISINFARYANATWNSDNPNEIGDIKGDGVYSGPASSRIRLPPTHGTTSCGIRTAAQTAASS